MSLYAFPIKGALGYEANITSIISITSFIYSSLHFAMQSLLFSFVWSYDGIQICHIKIALISACMWVANNMARSDNSIYSVALSPTYAVSQVFLLNLTKKLYQKEV